MLRFYLFMVCSAASVSVDLSAAAKVLRMETFAAPPISFQYPRLDKLAYQKIACDKPRCWRISLQPPVPTTVRPELWVEMRPASEKPPAGLATNKHHVSYAVDWKAPSGPKWTFFGWGLETTVSLNHFVGDYSEKDFGKAILDSFAFELVHQNWPFKELTATQITAFGKKYPASSILSSQCQANLDQVELVTLAGKTDCFWLLCTGSVDGETNWVTHFREGAAPETKHLHPPKSSSKVSDDQIIAAFAHSTSSPNLQGIPKPR